MHKDPDVLAACEAVLRDFQDGAKSLVKATIVTDDGFEVRSLNVGAQGGRLASMASSLQALSDAVAKEVRLDVSDYTLISAAQGHVLQMRVPGKPLVLCALFDRSETTGRALFSTKQIAEAISGRLAS